MKTETYTDQHGNDHLVTFDDLKFNYLESVDHTHTYECRGYDADGNIYSGIAEFTCDELDGITDIECIEPAGFKTIGELHKAEVADGLHNPEDRWLTIQEKLAKYKNLK